MSVFTVYCRSNTQKESTWERALVKSLIDAIWDPGVFVLSAGDVSWEFKITNGPDYHPEKHPVIKIAERLSGFGFQNVPTIWAGEFRLWKII
jgi:hypothetical protein